MPTNDESALFVARYASQLQESFLFPANPVQVVWSLYNKKAMFHLREAALDTHARNGLSRVAAGCSRILRQSSIPVMLKASDNIRTSRHAGKKMVIAGSKDELIRQYERDGRRLPSEPDDFRSTFRAGRFGVDAERIL